MTFGIIFSPTMLAIEDPKERFRATMCTIQGSVMVCGFIQVVLGYTGIFAYMLRYITPVTIARAPLRYVTTTCISTYPTSACWMPTSKDDCMSLSR